jgi:hypothetical protein
VLAVALAAMASNRRVHAHIADAASTWSRVDRFLVVA